MPRRAARALPLFCCAAAAPAPTTDQISYLHSGANATTRTLTSVLGERLSVRDFGATGDCLPAGRDVVTNASCAVDDTPAFVAALVWLKAARWDGGALHVPPGEYRIDGTVNLYGASMHLQYGARLKRVRLKEVAQSSNSAPVVRLATANSKLTGEGVLSSMNPTPRGVVNMGPEVLRDKQGANIGQCVVSGVHIQGPGCSWSWVAPSVFHPELNHSIGLCLDTGESLTNTGSNYQNSIHNVVIDNVDIGISFGNDVNANTVSGVQLQSIGQSAYHLKYRATENIIQGGFVGGGGGRVIVFHCEGCSENWLLGVTGEPGGDSQFFHVDCWRPPAGGPCYTTDPTTGKPIDLEVTPVHNTVLGNDNCEQGSLSTDSTFINLQHGQLHLGNFSSAKLDWWNVALQVEGAAYMQRLAADTVTTASLGVAGAAALQKLDVSGPSTLGELTSSYPATRVAASAPGVEAGVGAVELEPTLLQGTDADAVTIAPLRLTPEGGNPVRGAYFEITISGFGYGGDCASWQAACTYTGRYLVTPFSTASGDSAAFETLASSASLGDPKISVGATGQPALTIPMAAADKREVVVDVRRVGRGTDTPAVYLGGPPAGAE